MSDCFYSPLTQHAHTHTHTHAHAPTRSAKCIDQYIALKMKHFDRGLDEGEHIDHRLESIVNRMFQCCFEEGKYKQAVGIAFESRRIDILEKAIRECVSVYMYVLCSITPEGFITGGILGHRVRN